MKHTRVIAIVGGSGSGKTTLAKKLKRFFEAEGCLILGQDNYYLDQSHRFDRDGGSVNFDHPESLEFSLLEKHLELLREGRDIEVPIYDFVTHRRSQYFERVPHRPYIFVDGTLLLSQKRLLPLLDESIFLEVDEETRFQRRLRRDVEERGRTPQGVKDQFFRQVKIMHDEFVEPSKQNSTFLLGSNRLTFQNRNSSELRLRLTACLQELYRQDYDLQLNLDL